MKVCDYDLDFNAGNAYTCCLDDILMNPNECKIGSVITCEHCGSRLRLVEKNGKIVWVGIGKKK